MIYEILCSVLFSPKARENFIQENIARFLKIHLSPARLLGIEQHKGQLIPGADADLLVLNRDLSLRHVIVKGQMLED